MQRRTPLRGLIPGPTGSEDPLVRSSSIGVCPLIACGALALPAGAQAADMETAGSAVGAVSAHTDRTDAALDRAVTLFDANNDRVTRRAYARNRKQMGFLGSWEFGTA